MQVAPPASVLAARGGGGQDGGGGVVPWSTPYQVMMAISGARERLTAYDPAIFRYQHPVPRALQFAVKSRFETPLPTAGKAEYRNPIEKILTYLLLPLSNSKWAAPEDPNGKNGIPAPLREIAKARFFINDFKLLEGPNGGPMPAPFEPGRTGPCSSVYGDVDASVSYDENGSAQFCFSIGNLRRHSPQSIEKEAFCLMMHEAAHFVGFDEPDARLFQTFYADKYEKILFGTGDKFREMVIRILDHAQEHLIFSYSGACEWLDLGPSVGEIEAVELLIFNPLGVDRPDVIAHPDQGDMISDSIQDVITALHKLTGKIIDAQVCSFPMQDKRKRSPSVSFRDDYQAAEKLMLDLRAKVIVYLGESRMPYPIAVPGIL